MRLMAGLEQPTRGRIFMDGKDVTGVSVRKRNVSMVYQQFINYPSLTVRDNIASPLKLAKTPQQKLIMCLSIAEMLHIDICSTATPRISQGSSAHAMGWRQRCRPDSVRRAAGEPGLQTARRACGELRELFKARNCIAVYATTEPNEALALGGNTAVLHEGKLLQYGPTEQVYREPNGRHSAEMSPNWPINIVPGKLTATKSLSTSRCTLCDPGLQRLTPGDYDRTRLSYHPQTLCQSTISEPVRVDVAEISGSETFLHVAMSASSGFHLAEFTSFTSTMRSTCTSQRISHASINRAARAHPLLLKGALLMAELL